MIYLLFMFAILTNSIVAKKIYENDIREIYEKFIKSNDNAEYLNRYVPLPTHKNSAQWQWESKDFPRVISILEFERFVIENKLTCNKGLAINGIDPEWRYIKYNEVKEISYTSDKDKYDLHYLKLDQKDFDFVMVNQTLEHLYDPIKCLRNIYKHMKKGGILYFNVPANNIPHEVPFHYYTGFTPVGIGVMVKTAGFKILHIGQWGNLEYLKQMHSTLSWPDYIYSSNPGVNDLRYPLVTWIFAIK